MISFLIPAMRTSVFDAIDHINSLEHEEDYEIVVCSKFEVEGDNVVWAPEPKGQVGRVWLINECFRRSSGDYFVVTGDDVLVNPNVLDLPDFLDDLDVQICTVGDMSSPAGTCEAVEKHLDGVIFNESLLNVFAEDWLSYFLTRRGEGLVLMPHTDNLKDADVLSTSYGTHGYDKNVYTALCDRYTDSNSYNNKI